LLELHAIAWDVEHVGVDAVDNVVVVLLIGVGVAGGILIGADWHAVVRAHRQMDDLILIDPLIDIDDERSSEGIISLGNCEVGHAVLRHWSRQCEALALAIIDAIAHLLGVEEDVGHVDAIVVFHFNSGEELLRIGIIIGHESKCKESFLGIPVADHGAPLIGGAAVSVCGAANSEEGDKSS